MLILFMSWLTWACLQQEEVVSSGYRLGALVQNMDPSHFICGTRSPNGSTI